MVCDYERDDTRSYTLQDARVKICLGIERGWRANHVQNALSDRDNKELSEDLSDVFGLNKF